MDVDHPHFPNPVLTYALWRRVPVANERASVAELRARIEGPVNSIPTPFDKEGGIDWDGVASIVEHGISGGSRVALLTYGDSQFDFLDDDEVGRLTRFVVERVNRRAVMVAATRRWPDQKAMEFGRYCRDVGADVLMVLPSDFAGPAGRIEQYRAVAREIPVMLVGCPSYDILDELVDVPGICCFKEDGTESYAAETIRRYADHWTFVTGGQLWRNYTQWPFGCRAYFCWLAALVPKLSQEYWAAVQRTDAAAAGRIIREIEAPFFALASSIRGGWFALWRAALELNGVCSRYLRAPLLSATDQEMDRIREQVRKLGISS